MEKHIQLLTNIKSALPALESLLEQVNGHWTYEDGIYRFYHQSYKVFHLQSSTERIVKALKALMPQQALNPFFIDILKKGTGKRFNEADNRRWTSATRAILEAFFHARFFLEMACKYGNELESPPEVLPSGWAALLYLYGLR